MAEPVLTTEPEQFPAGDTVAWTKTLTDYPRSAWTLKYAFRGPAAFDVTATAGTGAYDYAVAVAIADTQTKPPGRYTWQAYVEDVATGSSGAATKRYTVGSGTTILLPNVAAVAHNGLESEAEVLFARVKAEITARLTGDGSGHVSYSIGGRSIQKFTLEELRKLRGDLAAQVFRERNTGRPFPQVAASFGPAGSRGANRELE